jgi:hypothetical protein
MNALDALRDAGYFFSHNLAAIARLCLPLILLESVVQQLIGERVDSGSAALASVIVGLLFYPLYSGALILFLAARSQGDTPSNRDVLAHSLRLWPAYALLASLSTLAIMLGASLFVLPGLWLMIKLSFGEFLLVLRGLPPLSALRASFDMTTGYFWPILLCVLAVMVPLWTLEIWLFPTPENQPDALLSILLSTLGGFLQLFTGVVLFRLFMLRESLPSPAE